MKGREKRTCISPPEDESKSISKKARSVKSKGKQVQQVEPESTKSAWPEYFIEVSQITHGAFSYSNRPEHSFIKSVKSQFTAS